MKTLPVALISALALLLAHVAPLSAREKLPIGMAASGAPIDAIVLDTETQPSRTVLVIGGLQGKMDGSSERVLDIGRRYDNDEAAQRAYRLILIPLANPDATALKFPPSGVAYRENPEANFLWRWLGLHAPDKVILIGDDDLGLAEALSKNVVAEVGRIPAARQRVRGAVVRLVEHADVMVGHTGDPAWWNGGTRPSIHREEGHRTMPDGPLRTAAEISRSAGRPRTHRQRS